jgi:hypothetical protein
MLRVACVLPLHGIWRTVDLKKKISENQALHWVPSNPVWLRLANSGRGMSVHWNLLVTVVRLNAMRFPSLVCGYVSVVCAMFVKFLRTPFPLFNPGEI